MDTTIKEGKYIYFPKYHSLFLIGRFLKYNTEMHALYALYQFTGREFKRMPGHFWFSVQPFLNHELILGDKKLITCYYRHHPEKKNVLSPTIF